MEPTSIISAVAIVVLCILTGYYAHYTKQLAKETRLARRDKPELRVRLSELSEEDLRHSQITAPYDTFLAFSALLINPGSVPIIIEHVTEKVNGQDVKGIFALPEKRVSGPVGVYVFVEPWVIPRDGFSDWSRFLMLDSKHDKKYLLTVKFDYSVGETRKETPVVSLPLTLKAGRGFKDVKLT